MERSEFSKATIGQIYGTGPFVVVLEFPSGIIERHYTTEQERNERIIRTRSRVVRVWNED